MHRRNQFFSNILKKQLDIFPYGILLMCGFLTIASLIGCLFRVIGLPESNIVVVYLLAVLLTALWTRGYILGIAASVAATLAFNYFFTVPIFTLAVHDLHYLVTFGIMSISALIITTLTSRIKRISAEAQQKEEEITVLYHLTSQLTHVNNRMDIASITLHLIQVYFSCEAGFLCIDSQGVPEHSFLQQTNSGKQIHRITLCPTNLQNHFSHSPARCYYGNEFVDEPIQGQERILGVIRIPKEFFLAMTKEQHRLLDSMVENTALAMDRLFATEQYLRSTEEANQERFRSNLLQAISHDLRTPLSGILGTAEILMDMTSHNPACYSLAEGIHKEADWLHALVENILSLTRIQNKPLSLHKQLEAAEEIVGSAVSHIQRRYPSQNITVTVPDSCLLVPMDAKLIAQVLMNLLDNAVKHSQLDGEIHLSVAKSADHNWAIFSVTDEGEGIAASDLPYIFQIFYTTSAKHMDASHGMGLGLPICQAIVKAHGGEMHIHNREHAAGVEVTFQLPLKEEISNEPTSGKNSNCRG